LSDDREYTNSPFDRNIKFFCSWSGGKDSCLALYRAIQTSAVPSLLLTLLTANKGKSETHALDVSLINAQSDSLGIPLRTYEIEENHYEEYESNLQRELLAVSKLGINGGVFGDTEYGLSKANRVCDKANMRAWLPLWHVDPIDTFNEFIDLGFKSVIVCCSNSMLGKEALGQTLSKELLAKMAKKGIDPLGEENEYHTFVYDGPIFSRPIHFNQVGEKRIGDYWVSELSLS
jgi:uncharacterized protein (TIGR00290 family)